MEIEKYFADALEFGEAFWKLALAEEEKKEEIREYIRHLAYLKRVRTFQKIPSAMQGKEWLSAMRGDYFLNPAVPCRREEYKAKIPFASGYHTHDYYELVFVLKGTYKQFVNGISYEHASGQVCLLPPEILHREELQSWEERILFIGLSQEFVEQELWPRINPEIRALICKKQNGQFSHQFLTFDMRDNETIQALLPRIMEEDFYKEAGHHRVIQGYLIRLIKELIDHTSWQCFQQSKLETEDSLIKEILCYMEEHLTTVTKNELATYFHFHPDYLGRFLLRKTGNTYSENLNSMRMKQSVKLMMEGESVNSVIQMLGFSNKGHFNKMFKNYYGMLPGEYKKIKIASQ